jgi:RHS repeat-associated protein
MYGYFGSGPTSGMLATVNNAVGNQTALTLDNAGRIVAETRGGATTGFGWDAAGLLTSLTPPGGSAHAMAHTPVDLLESYTPPAAGIAQPASSYNYNLDRQLTQSARPDGIAVDRTYDVAGRLESISLPGGVIQLGYVPSGSGQGHVSDLTGPYGVDLTFGYDGSLPTTTTWAGSVAGSVSHSFNSDLRVTQQTVSGAGSTSHAAFGYDADSLLTCASPTTCNPVSSDALRLTRSTQHGLVTQLDQGSSREVRTYNTFGELATQVGTYGGAARMSLTYHATAKPRDALGRVVDKVETVGSTTSNWHYTYDTLGRLTDVTLNGSAAEHFTYDANGNRTGYQSPSAGTLTATYDAQDRLITYGGWQYTYGANGEIESKTDTTTGAETLYQYDALGNLLGVWLPNGDVVEYLVDGLGRRVGKKLNGVVTRQWLYRDGLKPVAELNGAGTLQKQFVYGSHPLVPEFVVAGGITYRVMSDQLGSPRVLIDVATGTVQQQMRHSAFGEVLEDTNPGFTPFGFAGGMYDADTGLVRFGARDYDPSVGRWVSKDPIRFGGGQANLFVYVGNDAVNLVDPAGEYLWIVAGTLAGGAVNAAVAYTLNGNVGAAFVGGAVAGFGASFGVGGALAGGSLGTLAEQLLSGQQLDIGYAALGGALNVASLGLGVAAAERAGLKFAKDGLLATKAVKDVGAAEAFQKELKALIVGSIAGFDLGVAQSLVSGGCPVE